MGANGPAFIEDTPFAPGASQSARKAASEQLIRAYQHIYRLQTTDANCSRNYIKT